jgi:hypothetical protein
MKGHCLIEGDEDAYDGDIIQHGRMPSKGSGLYLHTLIVASPKQKKKGEKKKNPCSIPILFFPDVHPVPKRLTELMNLIQAKYM